MNRAVLARGLCPTCYNRFWQNGWLDNLPHQRNTSERVLDALGTDGGWLSTAAIHHLVEGSNSAVAKALFRLRTQGFIESRQLHGQWAGNEWRIL